MTQFNQAPKFDFFETDDGLSSAESPYLFDGDMGRAPLIQYFDKSFSPTYVSSGLVKPLVQSYNVPFGETGAVPGTYFPPIQMLVLVLCCINLAQMYTYHLSIF